MGAAELSDSAEAYGSDTLDDLRKDVVDASAFGLIGAGALLLLVIPFAAESIARETWRVALTLAGVGVSTRRALDCGLRQAADDERKLNTELAAWISHELRTPLNPIIGFSEMLIRDGWRDSDTYSILEAEWRPR